MYEITDMEGKILLNFPVISSVDNRLIWDGCFFIACDKQNKGLRTNTQKGKRNEPDGD